MRWKTRDERKRTERFGVQKRQERVRGQDSLAKYNTLKYLNTGTILSFVSMRREVKHEGPSAEVDHVAGEVCNNNNFSYGFHRQHLQERLLEMENHMVLH